MSDPTTLCELYTAGPVKPTQVLPALLAPVTDPTDLDILVDCAVRILQQRDILATACFPGDLKITKMDPAEVQVDVFSLVSLYGDAWQSMMESQGREKVLVEREIRALRQLADRLVSGRGESILELLDDRQKDFLERATRKRLQWVYAIIDRKFSCSR